MKFAVFDVDGTLLEMAIPTDFIEWLVKRKKFPKKVLNEIQTTIRHHGSGKISWSERGNYILNAWAEGFKGKNKKEIEEQAKEFMKEYDKIFPGSIEVMNYLKNKDYYLIAISRSFEEILEELKTKLPFDLVIGTKFEVKKGVYTGNLLNQMWGHETKKEILLDLIKEKNLDTKKSFAFGDSDQDSFMMQEVEFPVCVQPDKELKKIAEKNNWKTFSTIKEFYSELKEKGIEKLNLKTARTEPKK